MKKTCCVVFLMMFGCARSFVNSDPKFLCLQEDPSGQEAVFPEAEEEWFLGELEDDQELELFQEHDEQGQQELRNVCALLQAENPDYDHIRNSLERLTESDHAREIQGVAQYNLGTLYLDGRGVSRDLVQANNYFVAALENEWLPLDVQAAAWFGRGRIYYDAALLRNDQQERANLFDAARKIFSVIIDDNQARSFDRAQAHCFLGILSMKGEGVVQDFAQARECFERAVHPDSGLPLASCVHVHSALAKLYFNGNGCRQDYGEAERHAQFVKDNSTLAPSKLPLINYMLGTMYYNGSYDLERDFKKARECFESVGESVAPSQRNTVLAQLGDIYYRQNNLPAAKKVLEAVMPHGGTLNSRIYATAQYTLAQICCDTDPAVGQQDVSRARELFTSVAASEGDIPAAMRSGAQKTIRLLDRISDADSRPKKRARLQ